MTLVPAASEGERIAAPPPLIRKHSIVWSVSIYRGPTPFALAPTAPEPSLSPRDVPDVPAHFVADPFLLRRDGGWHLFFEAFNQASGFGEIAHASSVDGLSWSCDGVVLREPHHLSYPCVFRWRGDDWMVPEGLATGAVRLYRAARFPDRWMHEYDLLPIDAADPTFFHHAGRWWMFACTTPSGHDSLALYHAERLTGPWRPHPATPVLVGDRRGARPAGRVIVHDGRLYRFGQDCSSIYGQSVHAFEIVELTATTYRERAVGPILGPGREAWNARGMHHLDAQQLEDGTWIAAVDGQAFP